MIDFWIVRNGEDARKVAPEAANKIARHPNDNVCLNVQPSQLIGFVDSID